MNDPRQVAASIVGAVDWQTEVSGFCRCPGELLHTQPTGKKDCRVSVDGAPTIFCFHASCAAAVAEANLRLRRGLGETSWELKLPGGVFLRNGDVLQSGGAVLPREAIQARARAEGRDTGEQLLNMAGRDFARRLRLTTPQTPKSNIRPDGKLINAGRDSLYLLRKRVYIVLLVKAVKCEAAVAS